MAKQDRWNQLLDLLARDGRLEVEPAAVQLGVSTATVRRDLDELAQQQMLTRTRGGAVANSVSYDLPLRYKVARQAPEKQKIGMATAALIQPGCTVVINGGTTTTEVARAIATRADLHAGGQATAITIVTNALNIANELAVRTHIKIVLTGGVVRPQSYELIGPLATLAIAELTFDYAVLGVNGIDADVGATTHDEAEAAINRLMADRAREVVVVADSSKLNRQAFARICGLERIAVLVTDAHAAAADVAAFTELGLRVITA